MTRQIVSQIYGGLGNQLFQFAMGRAMALRSQSTLLLDKRYFANNVTYRLGHFNTEQALTAGRLPPLREHERLRYRLWRRLKLKPHLLKENGLAFHPHLLEPTTNVWLHGYWQSERYFADVADTIRTDLRIVTPASDENRRHLAMIAETPAISLHVRRGDYLLPENQTLFAACTESYYARALELIASEMRAEPLVYVFSDDPAWARDNLSLPFEKRVMGHNGRDDDYEDMRLMSACQHHIIANSTFSWWGAWLNPAPDKIVVAPATWFIDPKAANPDIIPEHWRRIANHG
ncbi:alpha-1,2-fucosyltransferase [Aminobacter sp. HY435]|uniref:alpha-1,2-fucosyltransferase n=1 Tax=Aminobacter sp. HY435 TaxID=2970917 RepID=UPI0022B9458E|nr:alpha-1,2-fucosyltransferase [Aminobacter sp. HY435]